MSEQCAPPQTVAESLVWIERLSGSRGWCTSLAAYSNGSRGRHYYTNEKTEREVAAQGHRAELWPEPATPGAGPFPLAAHPPSQPTPSLRGPPGAKLLLFSLPHTRLKPQKPHERCSLDPPVCGPETSAPGPFAMKGEGSRSSTNGCGIDRL